MGLLSRIRKFGKTLNIFRRCFGQSNRVSPMDMPDTDDEGEEIVHVVNISHFEQDVKATSDDRTPSVVLRVPRPLPPVIKVKKANRKHEKISKPTKDMDDPTKLQVSGQKQKDAKVKRKSKKKRSVAEKGKHVKNSTDDDASDSPNIIGAMIGDDSVPSTKHGVTTRNNIKRKADKRQRTQRDHSEDRSLRTARSSPQPVKDENRCKKNKPINDNHSSHSLSSNDALRPGDIADGELLNMVESYKASVTRETNTDRILHNWMERKLKEVNEADKK